ncbi:MAG: UDP-N-acetylglucosamine--N-acetylmuramyl-(pentapeptide) pyrophosphoryl-undecaprenol N-acetylglucosamine transferase, partial [Bacteriovoracia bacterium]
MKRGLIFIAAGGTGGHINSALAMGEFYIQKDYEIIYLTGKRELDYRLFAGHNKIHLDSRPLKVKNPFKLMVNISKNIASLLFLLKFTLQKKPQFTLGAGGYVCGPVSLACFITGRSVYILEQNSVMGLTNKLLSFLAKKIFISFHQTYGIPLFTRHKVIFSGNPIRNDFYEFDFSKPNGRSFSILVFGGSLGARDINALVLGMLKDKWVDQLEIIHQTGTKNILEVDSSQISANINYKQFQYIDDMKEAYRNCDLIICRGGASTIAELAVVKKPCIIIPLLIHNDRHQVHNATDLKKYSSFPVYITQTEELRA